MASYRTCSEVNERCPVAATTYGYYPNLPGNIVLLSVFGLCAIGQLVLGIKSRLRAFTFAVTVGCAFEAVGYGGRIIMHNNPWSGAGFKTQIVCLVISPSFLAAGIYLTLKHLVLYFGKEFSRLRPNLYTWIFISCDGASIVIQAIGGGIAAGNNRKLVNAGNRIIILGIAVQVVTMAACLVLAVDFFRRVLKHKKQNPGAATAHPLSGSRGFRFYLFSFAFAFVAILIRCIYRIPEMAGGWGNPLMRNEKEFLILDGAMCASASILMTVAHPGIFFPYMNSRKTDGGDKPEATETTETHSGSEK